MQPDWMYKPQLYTNTAIERCKQEIAAMEAQPENAPAWLTTLGITDWQMEMELLNALETRQRERSDQQ